MIDFVLAWYTRHQPRNVCVCECKRLRDVSVDCLFSIFLTNLKLVKPIKWAIHCGQAVEIYQYDIWEPNFVFGDKKVFIYKPHKDSEIKDEFAYWVDDEMCIEITKEQYNEHIKNETRFNVYGKIIS